MAVNGSAIETSMMVKLLANWPGYDFKSDYKLPAIGDINAYIDVNHHLPHVPMEQDVTQSGLNPDKMNTILVMERN